MADIVERANARLPFRIATFETVAQGLDYAARGQTGCAFFSSRGNPECSWSYQAIRERAVALARRLAAQGLARLSRIAIVGETSPEFLTAFFACQYAGLIPVPLPLSVHLGGGDTYLTRLRGMMRAAGASLAVGPPDLLPVLEDAAAPLGVPVATLADLEAGATAGVDPRALQADEPCYIQYSSGSTRQPRGVLVTQRAITHNARAIGEHGLGLRPGDCGTSWLPLYHDMGLVGFCLTPMLAQVPVHYLSPTVFARRPLVWLKVLSEHGGTISFSPTSGYELCVRAAASNGNHRLDLAHWRVAGVGGEMIRPDVLDRFAASFAEHGFSARAFVPSYGLAEATLAVSFGPLDSGARADVVSLDALESSGRAVPPVGNGNGNGNGSAPKVRAFALCGGPLPGHQISIRDGEGGVLPDRTVGRIWIKGPSVMQGYFNDPEATAAMITPDGWLDTGDLGYVTGHNLVITGRSKDLIIWNGRNIWPQDLEWALRELEGIRAGAVAAFGISDDEREQVVVIAECRSMDANTWPRLRREIATTLHRTAGVPCKVVLAAPRSLSYTSSGKLSRAATKTLYLEGAIRDVADPDATPDGGATPGPEQGRQRELHPALELRRAAGA